jgi:tripartite-type tricarboxylate transporter receptor subunit TctC
MRQFLIALLIACLPAWTTAGSAEEAAPFYAGKRLRLVVGSPAGGGYDVYARVLSRHLGRHLPGSPQIVVVNVPGAGSANAASYLANVAPQDGTELLMPIQTLPISQILLGPAARFDLSKFQWIGAMTDDANVFIAWHTANIRSVEDVRRRELIVGAPNRIGIGALYPAMMNRFMGTKFKIVLGYDGDVLDLAMERGEIQGRAGASWATLKATKMNRLRNHELDVFLQIGLKKEPDLASVPLLLDLAKTQEEMDILNFYSSLTAMARAIVAPAGVPAARTAALRNAFRNALNDRQMQDDARARNVELRPIDGLALQEIVNRMASTSPTSLRLNDVAGALP